MFLLVPPTRVVPDQRPLNGRRCCCSIDCFTVYDVTVKCAYLISVVLLLVYAVNDLQARIKAKPMLRSTGSFMAKESLKPQYEMTGFVSSKYTYTSPVPSIQYITPQVRAADLVLDFALDDNLNSMNNTTSFYVCVCLNVNFAIL